MADLDRYLDRLAPESDLETHKRLMRAQTEVKEIFLNLLKHGKTRQLYGSEHHLPRRFLDTFLKITEEFLLEFEMMLVDVEPDGLLYQEQPVFRNDEGEQLAYGLYSEGLRGLIMHRGASRKELERLADLLGRDWSSRGEDEEDLLAAAWRAEFEHVHIDVADRFSEEDESGDAVQREDLAMGRSSGADPSKMRGDSVLVPEIQGLLRELEANAVDAADAVRMKQDEIAFYLQIRDEVQDAPEEGGDEELIRLDRESASVLKREVAQISQDEDASIEQIARVIFETLRLHTLEAEALGQSCAQHVLRLTEAGGWGAASALLRLALALLDGDLFPEFDRADAFRRGYGALLNERGLDSLSSTLKSIREPETIRGPLFTILAPLPADCIAQLVVLGVGLKDEATGSRRYLADALVTLSRHDPSVPTKLLKEAPEGSQHVPLLALERLDYPVAVEQILRRARDPDPEIRELALRGLRRYQSPRIRSAMIDALDDPMPGVRIEALRYLSVYRDVSTLEHLGQRICSDAFGNFDDPEVKAWMMAYGLIGRADAVPILLRIALGDLQVSGRPAVVRPMAVRGLHASQSAQGRSALRQIGRSQPQLRQLIRSLTEGGRS